MSSLYFIYRFVFFFKQKTAYDLRISDWSSDVCSSDLRPAGQRGELRGRAGGKAPGVSDRRTVEEAHNPFADHQLRPLRSGGKGAGQRLRAHRPAVEIDAGPPAGGAMEAGIDIRSEEHTSELQSLMRISYAVFCLKKKKN